MTSIQRTLLAIALFLILAIGSFIWYVARWEADQPAGLSQVSKSAPQNASLFSDFKKSWGPGQRPGSQLTISGTPT